MARTTSITRGTRGTLGNPKGSLSRKAERLLRVADKADKAVATGGNAATRLDRNETGEFLVSALAAELYPDLGISVPKFPITARQILMGVDGFVAVPDPVWKSRTVQYGVPHPGIIFLGVVNAKNEAVKAADQIIQSGWADDLGDEFERARAKVRAGQIMVNHFHFLEGKVPKEFPMGVVWVAEDLVTDHCFAMAADQGVTLKGLRVRQSAQFAYDELMENLGGSIEVSAFEGELEYRYSFAFCPPQSVIMVVRSMMMVADGRVGELDEEVRDRLARFGTMYDALPADEKRLVVYAATNVLDDLQTMVDMEKARAALAGGSTPLTAGGNGHADVGEVADPSTALGVNQAEAENAEVAAA